jgi:hypothetical protein
MHSSRSKYRRMFSGLAQSLNGFFERFVVGVQRQTLFPYRFGLALLLQAPQNFA